MGILVAGGNLRITSRRGKLGEEASGKVQDTIGYIENEIHVQPACRWSDSQPVLSCQAKHPRPSAARSSWLTAHSPWLATLPADSQPRFPLQSNFPDGYDHTHRSVARNPTPQVAPPASALGCARSCSVVAGRHGLSVLGRSLRSAATRRFPFRQGPRLLRAHHSR